MKLSDVKPATTPDKESHLEESKHLRSLLSDKSVAMPSPTDPEYDAWLQGYAKRNPHGFNKITGLH